MAKYILGTRAFPILSAFFSRNFGANFLVRAGAGTTGLFAEVTPVLGTAETFKSAEVVDAKTRVLTGLEETLVHIFAAERTLKPRI